MAKKSDMAAGEGHNSGIDAEAQRVLFFMNRNEYVRLLAAKKAADAALKNVGKQIKADLGENGLNQIKLYEQCRTPEGEAKVKAAMQADQEAARWAGLPINTQADLFSDLAPLDERAFAEGEESGLRGDTFSNPYDENSQAGRQFKEGWQSGQAKLAEGIKQKAASENSDEHIEGEREDDPFATGDEQTAE